MWRMFGSLASFASGKGKKRKLLLFLCLSHNLTTQTKDVSAEGAAPQRSFADVLLRDLAVNPYAQPSLAYVELGLWQKVIVSPLPLS